LWLAIDTCSEILGRFYTFRHKSFDFYTLVVREGHNVTFTSAIRHLHHEYWRAYFEEVARIYTRRHWSL